MARRSYDLAGHMDLKVMARASSLYAKTFPLRDGDMLFACMYTAYDSLSIEQQVAYDDLTVVNSVSGPRSCLKCQSQEGKAKHHYEKPDATVERRLVRCHPCTERNSAVVW